MTTKRPAAKAKRGRGMAPPIPHSPYGYCPACGVPGVLRERRMGGNDKCVGGHVYPSRDALTLPLPATGKVRK